MTQITLISRSPEDTINIGKYIGHRARSGDTFALFGQLGSGKTTLAKGICSGLDYRDTVTSPSYTIMNVYQARLPIYHFDFYRLEADTNWAEFGLDEFLYAGGISLIEWPEKLKDELPVSSIRISLTPGGVGELPERTISIDFAERELMEFDSLKEGLLEGRGW